jgi:hypothetical protein
MVSITISLPWSRRRVSESKSSHAKHNLQGILNRHEKQRTHNASTKTGSAIHLLTPSSNPKPENNNNAVAAAAPTPRKTRMRGPRWLFSDDSDSDNVSVYWSSNSSLSSLTNPSDLLLPNGADLGSQASLVDLPVSMMYPRTPRKPLNSSSSVSTPDTGLRSSSETAASIDLFSRIRHLSSNATRDCLRVKASLRLYGPAIPLTDVSAADLNEIHQNFESTYQYICELQELSQGMNEDICRNLAYIRYECAIAEGDVLYAKLPQLRSDSLRTARIPLSSGVLLVIDEVLRSLHQIPLIMIAPHVIASDSPVLTQLKRWGNKNDGQVKTKHRNATVLRLPNKIPVEDHSRQSFVLCSNRLEELRSVETSAVICGDIVHFSIATNSTGLEHQRPNIRWSAATTPGAFKEGHLHINSIREHVALHLGIPSYKFELWIDDTKLEEGDEAMLYSWTHNIIRVVLDPILVVRLNGTSTILIDLSAHPENKAFMPVGFIKKKLRSMLGPDDDRTMNLFLQKEELIDDELRLFETGLLDPLQIEGLAPINLKADFHRPTKPCITCLEDKYHKRFMPKITKSCDHPTNICKKCTRRWIDERLDNKGTTIPCPECNSELDYDDVKRCATHEQFEKYDRLALVIILSQDPNFHWCISPTCESGQVHTSANPIFACTACGHKQCIAHKSPWHENETCAEYNNRVAGTVFTINEKASQKKIEETTKACPQCKARIEKNDGCDHMTCSLPSCKFQFCWECSCDWVKASHDAAYHVKTCKYYRPYGRR